MPSKQSGVALLSVMLVLAIAVILVNKNIDRTAQFIAQERAIDEQTKANELKHLAELMAISRLGEIQQNRQTKKTELAQLVEDGAPLVNMDSNDYPNWHLDVYIHDLQARLNLNRILIDEAYRDAYVELSSGYHSASVEAILDWLDKDTEIRSTGAEDYAYLSKNKAYLPANNAFSSAAEIRLVLGFSHSAWLALQEHVVALPASAQVNLNTASQKVIQALAPNIDSSGIISNRATSETEFTSQEAIQNSDLFSGGVEYGQHFALTSNFFELEIIISNESSEFRSRTRIDMRTQPNKIMYRAPVLDIPSTIHSDAERF